MQQFDTNALASSIAGDVQLGADTDEFRATVSTIASGDTSLRELQTRGDGGLIGDVGLLFGAIQIAIAFYQTKVSLKQTEIAAEQVRMMKSQAEKRLSDKEMHEITAEIERRLGETAKAVPEPRRQSILRAVVGKIFP